MNDDDNDNEMTDENLTNFRYNMKNYQYDKYNDMVWHSIWQNMKLSWWELSLWDSVITNYHYDISFLWYEMKTWIYAALQFSVWQ